MQFLSSFYQRRMINVRVFWVARVALALVYIWFGVLKLFALSPANPMVASLSQAMYLPDFLDWSLVLGGLEIIIGLLFLIPGWIAAAFWMMVFHLFLTFLPLVFLSDLTWQAAFVPTLEGQYIFKNVLLFSLGYILFEMRSRR